MIDKVKLEAYHLGFHLVGVTAPQPLANYATFENWLAQGRHGEMASLASERSRRCRAAPVQILPECESILVLGVRYHSLADTPISGPRDILSGRVAAFAWGTDYHDVLTARLEKLAAFIDAEAGYPVPKRCYTDTGPVLERDLAQRAGLGWIGKNSCLIHPRLGSFVFLSEMFLAFPFEPDPAFEPNYCGNCTRCIDACPTSCILPDRTLDARRCLAYLTIEHKGAVPPELRPLFGEWVFGCDICQQVCPWNQHASKTGRTEASDPSFAAIGDIPQPDLTSEIMLSSQAFNAKFRKSSIKRAKRSGYLRNLAIAMGNSRDPAAVTALKQVLFQDSEPLVRSHAAWALGQIDHDSARLALQQAVGLEKDDHVVREIRGILDRMGNI